MMVLASAMLVTSNLSELLESAIERSFGNFWKTGALIFDDVKSMELFTMKDLMKTSIGVRQFNVLVLNGHQEPKVVTGCMSKVADMLLKKLKVVSENDVFEQFNCRINSSILSGSPPYFQRFRSVPNKL